MSYPFKPWPKIARLEKLAWTITEKLDGTNGIIDIVLRDSLTADALLDAVAIDGIYAVFAGSRTRWLQPNGTTLNDKGKPDNTTDNYGFAAWVKANARDLVALLGEGTHYGEWWGQGIQRGYGMDRKQFSLFTPWRYPHIPEAGACVPGGQFPLVTVVPVLAQGDTLYDLAQALSSSLTELAHGGSVASPATANPEGIVVYLGGEKYKVIVNEGPKEGSRG